MKTFAIPVSKDTYATCFESGDHDGEIIGSVLLRSICSFEPSASATISGTTYNLESGSESGLFTYTLAVGTSYEISESTDIYGKLTYLGTEDYSVGVENIDGLGSFVVNLGARFTF